jgi:hypothetical protein
MATGENNTTWGDVTNLNLGTALEEAIVGSADVTFASADVTLTLTDTNASQTARNMRLRCTGTTGGATRNLVVPSIEKPYIVRNDCADSVVVKTAAGTGITVPAGKTMWVYSDATNVVDAVTHLSSLTLGTDLAVSDGGTGASTFTANGVIYGNTTSALLATAAGTTGQVLVGNTGGAPSWATLTGIGVTSFSAGTTGFTPSTATTGAITLAGTLGVANGGTGTTTAFTAGSVVFAGASGVYSQDNANLFWDNTNDRLGIGTATPSQKLQVSGSSTSPIAISINNNDPGLSAGSKLSLAFGGTETGYVLSRFDGADFFNAYGSARGHYFFLGATEAMRIDAAGNLLVGTTTASYSASGRGLIETNGSSSSLNVLKVAGTAIAYFGCSASAAEIATPGANPLLFVTNNTERMRINSTGNVLMGTSVDFGGRLTLIPTTNPTTASASTNQIAIGEATNNTAYRMNIGYIFTGGYASSIQSIAGSVGAYLLLNADGGNVGVGTMTPTLAKLQVVSDGAGASEIVASNTVGVERIHLISRNTAGNSYIQSQNSTCLVGTYDNYSMQFLTNNTERMRIDTSGNVIVGGTAGNGRLTVRGAGTGAAYSFETATSGGATRFILSDNGEASFYNSSSAISMRVASTGEVGVGTTTPRAQLDVGTNASGSTTSTLHLGYSGLNFYGFRIANTMDPSLESAGTLSFQRGTTAAWSSVVTISDVGNLGVGTATPVTRLDVREANRADSTNIANVGIYTTTAQSTGVGGTLALGGLFNGADTAPFGSIRGGKQNSTSGNYDGYLAFQTIANGGTLTENMRITAAGNVNISNGNLVIGTALKGIDFSADSHAAGMTSELLDDYEEGTFTPVLSSDGTPPTVSGYANQYGSYTKIGNRVFISVNIRATVTNVGTGTPQITGFPYAANSSTLNGVSLGLTDLMTVPFNANYINGSVLILALGAYTIVTNGYLTFSAMYEIN